jgi:hypothetical protein
LLIVERILALGLGLGLLVGLGLLALCWVLLERRRRRRAPPHNQLRYDIVTPAMQVVRGVFGVLLFLSRQAQLFV